MSYHYSQYHRPSVVLLQERAGLAADLCDGIWGPDSVLWLSTEELAGLYWSDLDPATIKDIQSRVGVKEDGFFGADTQLGLKSWIQSHGRLSWSEFNAAWDDSGPIDNGSAYSPQDVRWFQVNDSWGQEGRPFIIDVSHHQGAIDWDKVAREANLGGVILKATEGRTYEDPKFPVNRAACRAHNLRWGIYHYCHLAWDGARTRPVDQADNVMRALSEDLGALGIWLDLETKEVAELVDMSGAASTADWIEELGDILKRRTGRTCGLYWSRRAITENLGTEGYRFQDSGMPMWWAYYAADPSPLNRWGGYPAGHSQLPDHENWPWHLWQFSSTGHVPGIQSSSGQPRSVDLNVFNGDQAAFDRFIESINPGTCG